MGVMVTIVKQKLKVLYLYCEKLKILNRFTNFFHVFICFNILLKNNGYIYTKRKRHAHTILLNVLLFGVMLYPHNFYNIYKSTILFFVNSGSSVLKGCLGMVFKTDYVDWTSNLGNIPKQHLHILFSISHFHLLPFLSIFHWWRPGTRPTTIFFKCLLSQPIVPPSNLR